MAFRASRRRFWCLLLNAREKFVQGGRYRVDRLLMTGSMLCIPLIIRPLFTLGRTFDQRRDATLLFYPKKLSMGTEANTGQGQIPECSVPCFQFAILSLSLHVASYSSQWHSTHTVHIEGSTANEKKQKSITACVLPPNSSRRKAQTRLNMRGISLSF